MSLFFRKSISFGPLRLNLSKSRIGASLKVPGLPLRIGSGPRGLYASGGSHGIYFRKYARRNSVNQGEAFIEQNKRETVTMQEMVYSNMLTINALVELLDERGVLPKASSGRTSDN